MNNIEKLNLELKFDEILALERKFKEDMKDKKLNVIGNAFKKIFKTADKIQIVNNKDIFLNLNSTWDAILLFKNVKIDFWTWNDLHRAPGDGLTNDLFYKILVYNNEVLRDGKMSFKFLNEEKVVDDDHTIQYYNTDIVICIGLGIHSIGGISKICEYFDLKNVIFESNIKHEYDKILEKYNRIASCLKEYKENIKKYTTNSSSFIKSEEIKSIFFRLSKCQEDIIKANQKQFDGWSVSDDIYTQLNNQYYTLCELLDEEGIRMNIEQAKTYLISSNGEYDKFNELLAKDYGR